MTSCAGGALGLAAFLLFLTEHSPERAKMIGFGGSVTPSAPAGPEGRGGQGGAWSAPQFIVRCVSRGRLPPPP